MPGILQIPSDLEQREVSRLFVRKLQVKTDGKMTSAAAMLCVYQTWIEWATAATEWRPLKNRVPDPQSHEWVREELTHIIESYCMGFTGEPGQLLQAAIESNFMLIETRGDEDGLILAEFWRFNAHLDPNHKTIQQQGGLARAARRRAQEAASLAEKQKKIFDLQGELPFGTMKPTQEEEKAAFALIIRMDRACGKGARASTQYSPEINAAALKAVRIFDGDVITAVEEYLVDNRENPTVVKEPDRVIMQFQTYAEASQA